MAKVKVVSVKDRALDSFSRPFFVPTLAAAERSFSDEVNNKESPMFSHAVDYDLYLLGEFDEETGGFECVSPVQLVARAQDLKKPE